MQINLKDSFFVSILSQLHVCIAFQCVYLLYFVRFGSGPYYVEFTLQLEGQKQYVTMEIAPNHVQPLAVKTFLTMVDNKALDGSHIISHPHKDNIAISMPDELNGVSVIQHLAPNLLLNEYSEESPQSEGVFFCLPRRRGGPHDFYIHVSDKY